MFDFSTILRKILELLGPKQKEEQKKEVVKLEVKEDPKVTLIKPELVMESEREIAWKKSPNYKKKPGKRNTAIILHHTGSFNSSGELRWMCDPEAKVSAHYLIALDGKITQMVRDEDIAWHAGKSELDGERFVNNFSLGIEVTGDTNKKAFKEEQLEALAWLVKTLIEKHKIEVHRVVSHREISPGRKTDLNSDHFDWAEFYRSIGAID